MQLKKYSITLLNDDVTTKDQALQIVMHVFNKSLADATAITAEIHNNGSAIIGEFIHEVAETKICEVESLNQLNDLEFRARVNYDDEDVDDGLEQFKADVKDKFNDTDTPSEE